MLLYLLYPSKDNDNVVFSNTWYFYSIVVDILHISINLLF